MVGEAEDTHPDEEDEAQVGQSSSRAPRKKSWMQPTKKRITATRKRCRGSRGATQP